MTQLCLDQLFELQLKNYINESCHGFTLFSTAPTLQILTKSTTLPISRWKTCMNASNVAKAKIKHKTLSNWPVSLWVLVCDPIQNAPWAEKQRKVEVRDKLHSLVLIETFTLLYPLHIFLQINGFASLFHAAFGWNTTLYLYIQNPNTSSITTLLMPIKFPLPQIRL